MGKAVERYMQKYRGEVRERERVGMGKRRKSRGVQKLAVGERTRRQQEYDGVVELRRYLQGWSYREIADEVNRLALENGLEYRVSPERVRCDIQRVLDGEVRKMRESGMVDTLVAKESAKLDLLEKEAWFDYLKSREKRVTVKTVDGQVSETVRDSVGNPKFLDVLLRIMERRAKLLGVDSPVQVDITARQGGASRSYDFSGIPEEQLSRMADALLGARREVPAEGVVVDGGENGQNGENGESAVNVVSSEEGVL